MAPPPNMVRYVETRGDAYYAFDESALGDFVRERSSAGDWQSIEDVVKELFRNSNQGRRPWSLAGERSLLALARSALQLLQEVRLHRIVSAETYDAIDPSRVASAIHGEGAQLERLDLDADDAQHAGNARWRETLGMFETLIAIYASVFDAWATDHPERAKAPPPQLLDAADDAVFTTLLRATAQTRTEEAQRTVDAFRSDEEQWVADLARELLQEHFGARAQARSTAGKGRAPDGQ